MSDELFDLKRSFEDGKDYKGYMVKQVIDKRIEAAVNKDNVIALRCDGCGEMNEEVGYNPEYKTSFWCKYCGQSNDIKVMYYSRKNPNQTLAPLTKKYGRADNERSL